MSNDSLFSAAAVLARARSFGNSGVTLTQTVIHIHEGGRKDGRTGAKATGTAAAAPQPPTPPRVGLRTSRTHLLRTREGAPVRFVVLLGGKVRLAVF